MPEKQIRKKREATISLRKRKSSERTLKVKQKEKTVKVVEKYPNNPILSPIKENLWENRAVFNPAAVLLDDGVYLLYRAIGEDDRSVLGQIKSTCGEIFDNRHRKKFYEHNVSTMTQKKISEKINYSSGGGGEGGSEDPRLVKIGDTIYLIYMAFNGWDSARLVLTTISEEDFKKGADTWSEKIFISPPGQIHKNWVLFPEKINGKFAILHCLSPHIMIHYFDSVDDFKDENYIFSNHQGSPLWNLRDKNIRGVGPPPIKTSEGWLILYHGTNKGEYHKYKLFAMLLDLQDPTKILYNYKEPIIEPECFYEVSGVKPNIVYCCGAVVKNEKIYIYYGGADNVVCLAKANLQDLLETIKKGSGTIVFKQAQIKKYRKALAN